MWAAGLVQTLKDTGNHIISSNLAVVILDKFPKAQHHYLICPKEVIQTIFDLKRDEHLELLDELKLLALNVLEVKQLRPDTFKMGFHAEPSMQQVHMHLISQDFVSDCLKTKKHWNSFNTSLFLPYEVARKALEQDGCIRRIDKDEVNRLINTELICNRKECKFVAKNMPTLKKHLLDHFHQKEK